MFKSLFRLVGRVVDLFTGSNIPVNDPELLKAQESLKEGSEAHAEIDEGDLPDVGDVQRGRDNNELEIETDEIEMFAEDWGGQIPQRASALFPQTIPQRARGEQDTKSPPSEAQLRHDIRSLEEVQGRNTPSAHELFTEAEANIKPNPPPPRPDRPYPQPYQPNEPEPTVGNASSSPRQYRADVQVGRLMKHEPPPRKPAPYGHVEPPREVVEIHRPPKRARRRMAQGASFAGTERDLVHFGESGSGGGYQLPPPPRGFSGGNAQAPLAYHDLQGDRGATSRSQQLDPYQVSQISPPQQSFQPIELNQPALHNSSLFERLRPTTPPPALKPKPIRFKEGNYLRFWGNYSAQPHYLHFGSLIRSERFIDLLPIWHDELDELEVEAREEWSHLDSDLPFEGEADWRRLLNPTMSSPIDFLLHRDRVEQLTILPRGRGL